VQSGGAPDKKVRGGEGKPSPSQSQTKQPGPKSVRQNRVLIENGGAPALVAQLLSELKQVEHIANVDKCLAEQLRASAAPNGELQINCATPGEASKGESGDLIKSILKQIHFTVYQHRFHSHKPTTPPQLTLLTKRRRSENKPKGGVEFQRPKDPYELSDQECAIDFNSIFNLERSKTHTKDGKKLLHPSLFLKVDAHSSATQQNSLFVPAPSLLP